MWLLCLCFSKNIHLHVNRFFVFLFFFCCELRHLAGGVLAAPWKNEAQCFPFRYKSQMNSHLASQTNRLLADMARSHDTLLELSVSPCANKATCDSSETLAPVVIVFQTILDRAGPQASTEAARPWDPRTLLCLWLQLTRLFSFT